MSFFDKWLGSGKPSPSPPRDHRGRPTSPARGRRQGGGLSRDGQEMLDSLARGRRAEETGAWAAALEHYKTGIEGLLEHYKNAAGGSSLKQNLEEEIKHYMTQAERLKALLGAQAQAKEAGSRPVGKAAAAGAGGQARTGYGVDSLSLVGRGSLEKRRAPPPPSPPRATTHSTAAAARGRGVTGTSASRGKTSHSSDARGGTASSRGGNRSPPRRANGSMGRPGAGTGVAARAADSMEQTVLDEMLDSSLREVTWDSISGLSEQKRMLQEAVVLPALRPDLFTGLREPPKGILLYGPPGTGKTLLAKAVASSSGYAFFCVSAASITSKFLGEGEKMVRALFKVARERQPAVIFLDEIDSILSARGDQEHEASRRLKTEFMVQLDGMGGDSKDRILFMGATNLPMDLDEAVLRRMAKRIYVPLPSSETRRELLVSLLGSCLSDKEVTSLATRTELYSCSDLTQLCKEAAMMPIRELGIGVLSAREEDLRAVTASDVVAAMKHIAPSVSAKTIQTFEDWEKATSSG